MLAWSDNGSLLALADIFPGNIELTKDIIKGLLAAAAVAVATWLAPRVYRLAKRLWSGIFKPDDNSWRVERARGAVQPGGPGLWLAISPGAWKPTIGTSPW